MSSTKCHIVKSKTSCPNWDLSLKPQRQRQALAWKAGMLALTPHAVVLVVFRWLACYRCCASFRRRRYGRQALLTWWSVLSAALPPSCLTLRTGSSTALTLSVSRTPAGQLLWLGNPLYLKQGNTLLLGARLSIFCLCSCFWFNGQVKFACTYSNSHWQNTKGLLCC